MNTKEIRGLFNEISIIKAELAQQLAKINANEDIINASP